MFFSNIILHCSKYDSYPHNTLCDTYKATLTDNYGFYIHSRARFDINCWLALFQKNICLL